MSAAGGGVPTEGHLADRGLTTTEPVTDTPGWEDTTREAISGGLHVFAHLACTYNDKKRYGARGRRGRGAGACVCLYYALFFVA